MSQERFGDTMPDITPRTWRIATAAAAMVLGWTGLQKFILGFLPEGIILLIGSVLLGLVIHPRWIVVTAAIGLVEGVILLRTSDEAFAARYLTSQRKWF